MPTFVCLFICGLLNEVVSTSNYTVPKKIIVKDMKLWVCGLVLHGLYYPGLYLDG